MGIFLFFFIFNNSYGDFCVDSAIQKHLSLLEQSSTRPISAHEQEILENYIFPHIGHRFSEGCSLDGTCFRFRSFPGEKELRISFDPTLINPKIVISPQSRTLLLPTKTTSAELKSKYGESIINRWSLSTSYHPYTSMNDAAVKFAGVSKETLRRRRYVQEEGIRAGNEILARHKGFLYISPTGTGKTEVLKALMEDQIRKNPSKIHIFTAHQSEIVSQFEKEIKRSLGEKIVIVKSGEPRVILEAHQNALKQGKTLVVATPVQGISYHLRDQLQDLRKSAQQIWSELQNDAGLMDTQTKASLNQALQSAEREITTLSKTYDDRLETLAKQMGSVTYDEAHHLGAETWSDAILSKLLKYPESKIIGATATPIHARASIQELFGGRSFWAYLDHNANDVIEAAKRGDGIFRDEEDVIKQLANAVMSGELSPNNGFFVMPASKIERNGIPLRIKKDPNIKMSPMVLNSAYYKDLAVQVEPLVKTHNAGFFAVDTIEEARDVQKVLQDIFGKKKKFVLFHGGLSEKARAEIVERMRNREDLFLITVDLLNEGVDFSHLTLYVDWSSNSDNLRQTMQRIGRVARTDTGKEGFQAFILGNWSSLDELSFRINTFDKLQAKAKELSGDLEWGDLKNPTKGHHVGLSDPNTPTTFYDILDSERKDAVERLANSSRTLFYESPNSQAPRILAYWREKGVIPETLNTPEGAFLNKLPNDMKQWPESWPQPLKEAMAKRRNTSSDSVPAMRILKYWQDKKALPPNSVRVGAGWRPSVDYQFMRRLPEDPDLWPDKWPDDLKLALLDRMTDPGARPPSRVIFEYWQKNPGKLPPLTQKLETGRAIYTKERDLIRTLPEDQSQWPSFWPKELKEAVALEKPKIRTIVKKSKRAIASDADDAIWNQIRENPLFKDTPAERIRAYFELTGNFPPMSVRMSNQKLRPTSEANLLYKLAREHKLGGAKFPDNWPPELVEKFKNNFIKVEEPRALSPLEDLELLNSLSPDPLKWPKTIFQYPPETQQQILERVRRIHQFPAGAPAISP